MDDAMFGQISKSSIFNEFKQEEDYEHTNGFLAKYLNAHSHYADLDQFIKKLENLQEILDPNEKRDQVTQLNYEGFGPSEVYIYVLFAVFGKVISAIKTFEASNENRTALDESIIRKTEVLLAQINEQAKPADHPNEAMVSIKKLCNLYYRAAKFRDEDTYSHSLTISEKTRNEVLGNNDIDQKNITHHKRMINSISLKLEEAEMENHNLQSKLVDYEDLIATFFHNCKSVIVETELINKISHVKTEKDFDSKTIKNKFYRYVDLYHKCKPI
jgi:hypothetical protein